MDIDRGENWDTQRYYAKVRDGFVCQCCLRNEIGQLEVHHIIPYRTFDGDWRKANVLSNLITLCEFCHPYVECGAVPVLHPLDQLQRLDGCGKHTFVNPLSRLKTRSKCGSRHCPYCYELRVRRIIRQIYAEMQRRPMYIDAVESLVRTDRYLALRFANENKRGWIVISDRPKDNCAIDNPGIAIRLVIPLLTGELDQSKGFGGRYSQDQELGWREIPLPIERVDLAYETIV